MSDSLFKWMKMISNSLALRREVGALLREQGDFNVGFVFVSQSWKDSLG